MRTFYFLVRKARVSYPSITPRQNATTPKHRESNHARTRYRRCAPWRLAFRRPVELPLSCPTWGPLPQSSDPAPKTYFVSICFSQTGQEDTTYPVHSISGAVDSIAVRDIEPDLLALRNHLRVRVEAVRAHEVAHLDNLLCGRRAVRLGARVFGEEVRLCGCQFVCRMRGQIVEDLNYQG